MDINIAFLTPQSDILSNNSQPIENKQDFSIVMAHHIVPFEQESIKTENMSTDIYLEHNLYLDEVTQNSEKNILSIGNVFPLEKEPLEEKEGTELIYGIMFNPISYQENDNLPKDVIHTETLNKNTYRDTVKNNEILQSGPEEKENNLSQLKYEININNPSRDVVYKNSMSENITFFPTMTKADMTPKSSHESNLIIRDDISPIEDDEKNYVISGLIPSDFSTEVKLKNKIQAQISSYENMSEFKERSIIDNEYIQSESKEMIQENQINYDPNNIQSFEKEIGENLISMIKESDHQVKLKVNPPELGSIDIDLDWTDEQAHVSFYTENMQVMAAIEASISELKNLFNEQNLSLGDVNVFNQDYRESKKQNEDLYNHAQENDNIESKILNKSTKQTINRPSSGNISVFV